ncbi:MAG: shikimate kinase [Gammaproteobacteria bacterium]|jgi:shikimate kinase
MRIIIIGPTGSGKTTLGRKLAKDLRLDWYDVDQWIEDTQKQSITDIFLDGEERFRKIESDALEILSKIDNCVISTGAGIVLNQDNRTILSKNYSIFLDINLDEQFRRVKKSDKRPLLNQGDVYNTLSKMREVRDPLYRNVANHIVDTSGLSQRQVLQLLKGLLSHDH